MKKRAFTLIELLVVVSIIALLVAILMPALGKARQQARRTVCMTHLKDIGTSIGMYTTEQNDFLPYDCNLNGRDLGLLNYCLRWENDLTGASPNRWVNQGRLYETGMAKNPEIFYCPSEKPTSIGSDYKTYWNGGLPRPEVDVVADLTVLFPSWSDGQKRRIRASYLARPVFKGEKSRKKDNRQP